MICIRVIKMKGTVQFFFGCGRSREKMDVVSANQKIMSQNFLILNMSPLSTEKSTKTIWHTSTLPHNIPPPQHDPSRTKAPHNPVQSSGSSVQMRISDDPNSPRCAWQCSYPDYLGVSTVYWPFFPGPFLHQFRNVPGIVVLLKINVCFVDSEVAEGPEKVVLENLDV